MKERLRISTLDAKEYYIPVRRMGNTTRQVDFAIQKLFDGYVVKMEDHFENGKHRVANKFLFARVMERLEREFRMSHRKNFEYDEKNLTIQLNY